jgi:hypothetical protein
MLGKPSLKEWPPNIPRLLPGDDKVHLALIDCQRDSDSINELIQAIRTYWFARDPPDRGKAQATAAELDLLETKLRGAILELRRTIDPIRR